MRAMLHWGIGLMFVGAVGCGDDHEHGHEESPAVDACEHLEEGPVIAVIAGAGDTAPTLSDSHTRYDIDLSSAKDVKVPIGEAAEYYFYFASATGLVVKDASGAVVPSEQQGSSSEDCDLVGAWFVFDLEVGTYTFELTPPAPSTDTQLVFFEAGHEH